MKYDSIDEALKDGFTIHAFRSGGGLRVLSMKRPETVGEKFGISDEKKFYAEGATLNDAIRILKDDVKAGGRKYKDVYGVLEEHYLTGSYSDKDELDNWVASGRKFDISFEDGQFTIDMTEMETVNTPEAICQRVYKQERVFWKRAGVDGIFYESYPERLANGDIACCTGTNPPRNGNEGMFEVKRIAKGSTLTEALFVAIKKTEPIEPEWEEIPDPKFERDKIYPKI